MKRQNQRSGIGKQQKDLSRFKSNIKNTLEIHSQGNQQKQKRLILYGMWNYQKCTYNEDQTN